MMLRPMPLIDSRETVYTISRQHWIHEYQLDVLVLGIQYQNIRAVKNINEYCHRFYLINDSTKLFLPDFVKVIIPDTLQRFPTVDQGHWPEHHAAKNDLKTKKGIPLKYFITSPLDVWIGKAINDQFEKLTRADGFSQKHPVAKDKTSALLFDNIPEIMLAPLELEVSSEVRKPNQHYLGLCISEHRQDTELDSSFENRFQEIVDRKKVGNHLIYCTFGTFYQGSDRALLDFLNKLLGAIQELENVDAIFSVNKLVIETLRYQRKIPANIHMFSRVPQLRVLQHADLFVTHGGLGSVKESIYYGVPMLVYPLDLQYDQNGNGLKVEHHGLGLRGVFSYERSGDMKKKILELLEDRSYTQNIRKFREICQTSYSSDKLNLILNQILLHP